METGEWIILSLVSGVIFFVWFLSWYYGENHKRIKEGVKTLFIAGVTLTLIVGTIWAFLEMN